MSRLQKTCTVLDALDASRSSSSLDPTLSTLSPRDIAVLDAIISKVPDATAFMTVFKAYSEVLRQRGMDPGNDVVYYKQLLKLGVIRGADWGAKWLTVKSQLGHAKDSATLEQSKRKTSGSRLARFDEDDVFTSPSHLDETETAVDPAHLSPDRSGIQGLVYTINTTHVNRTGSPGATRQHKVPISQSRTESSIASKSDEGIIPLSIPQLPQRHRYRAISNTRMNKTPMDLHEKTSNHLNEADAWRNIQRSRHLEDAVRFRRESLLAMCLNAWKAGLDWIYSTNAQIDQARKQVQLQVYFARWKARAAGKRRGATEAMMIRGIKMLGAAFQRWRIKAGRQAANRWKEKMRTNILHLRRREEGRICNEAWTRWRQLYISRQVYARNTLHRAIQRWRTKLKTVGNLEVLADQLDDARVLRTIGNTFETWYRCVQLRDGEKYFLHQQSRHMLSSTMGIWIRNLYRDNYKAKALYSKLLTKQSFKTWRKAIEKKRLLVSRSDKYLRRRHHLLIRAVIRVWIARERGRLLDRVKSARLIRSGFSLWRQRVTKHGYLRSEAISFSQNSTTRTLASAFNTWIQRRQMVANQERLADDRYTSILLYQTLLIWRLQLRAQLKILRKAKMARRLFVARDAWNKWRLALANKVLARKVQILMRESLRRAFMSWLCKLRQRRYEEQVVHSFERRSQRHLLLRSLQHWTDRIVFVRLRELDITELSDKECLSRAFVRWRWALRQHTENLSLLDSFQVVKREDTLRRMFMRWSALARKARIRRTRLAVHEDELRIEILTAAWETWRDRFREIGLRDLEYQVIIQNQRSTLHHAFIIWCSQSKSVPAIRQYAINLKFKIWQVWRTALPLAKQTRQARGVHAKRLLSTIFEKWQQAYRTKVALKAVARARHLRLPSPGFKPSSTNLKPQDSQNLRPTLHRPLRSYALKSNIDGSVPSPRVASLLSGTHAITRKKGLSSLLVTQRTPRFTTAPELTPSINVGTKYAVDGDRRDQLWNELRGAQLHNNSES